MISKTCVCGSEAKHRCARCHFTHYCSKECQKNDWENQHKHYCSKKLQTKIRKVLKDGFPSNNIDEWGCSVRVLVDEKNPVFPFQLVKIRAPEEAFWVIIVYNKEKHFLGQVDNTLHLIPGYNLGDLVAFEAKHIVAIAPYEPAACEEYYKRRLVKTLNDPLQEERTYPICLTCELRLHEYMLGISDTFDPCIADRIEGQFYDVQCLSKK